MQETVVTIIVWEVVRRIISDLWWKGGEQMKNISVSSVLARIKELEEKLTPKTSTQARVTILYTINELKQLIK